MVDENQIIRSCQAGRLEDFTVLYDRYVRKIYDFIYYKTHHKETAEDLVSETFFRALDRIGTFDPGRGTFQAWLYQIARNQVIDHYRRQRPTADIEDAWDLGSGEDVARDTGMRLELEAVREAMRSLKPAEREIITLRLWQEMGYDEIAAALGKSEEAAKMAYSRAIRSLRGRVSLAALIVLISAL